MRLSKFIAGLAILAPYFTDPDGHHIGAEHDQFFVYKTDRPIPAEDIAKLRELGWFQLEADDTEPPEYDPEDGWSAFT